MTEDCGSRAKRYEIKMKHEVIKNSERDKIVGIERNSRNTGLNTWKDG